jgi:lipopolysaccharide/colanic/teichoic acid biosynthesis glycosyltransferase
MVTKAGESARAVAPNAVLDLSTHRVVIRPFDSVSVFALPSSIYLSFVKPMVDRLVGLLALILAFPLLLVVGLSVWLAMDFPVLLGQERVGRHGRVFRMWKFRTMEEDRRRHQMHWVGEDRRKTHKSAGDPRITKLGRFLRATRLDELPQFINVARGDISLVGPRPELLTVVAEYEPWQHRRHAVKPGLTGLWQISDRGDKLLKDCTELELEYLDSVSFITDVQILARTLPALMRRSGI